MAKKAVLTQIVQTEVEILEPHEHEKGVEGYDYNNPKAGGKWELVRLPNKSTVWCPILPHSFNTPMIQNQTKVRIVVDE